MRTGEGEVTELGPRGAHWGCDLGRRQGVPGWSQEVVHAGDADGPQPSVLLRGRSPVSILPWGAEAGTPSHREGAVEGSG